MGGRQYLPEQNISFPHDGGAHLNRLLDELPSMSAGNYWGLPRWTAAEEIEETMASKGGPWYHTNRG